MPHIIIENLNLHHKVPELHWLVILFFFLSGHPWTSHALWTDMMENWYKLRFIVQCPSIGPDPIFFEREWGKKKFICPDPSSLKEKLPGLPVPQTFLCAFNSFHMLAPSGGTFRHTTTYCQLLLNTWMHSWIPHSFLSLTAHFWHIFNLFLFFMFIFPVIFNPFQLSLTFHHHLQQF